MIGIIGAMEVEVRDLLNLMPEQTSETISGIVYHKGKISGIDCVVAQCGIGKVAAAVCAQTMILQYHPTALLNVGVAGGTGSRVKIGDIVISTSLVQHDMDTTALGDEKGFLSGPNIVHIPASDTLVNHAVSAAQEVLKPSKIHTGIIATGDQFVCDSEQLGRIAEEFGASACEMEGGSIAQVCYLNKVDFVVIRAISDNANEHAAMDFTEFAEQSAKELTELIKNLLPKI
jgi:adenosylhomocysteine nucleosidase